MENLKITMEHFNTSKLRVSIDQLSTAEQLVGFGFRCWLAGYQNNDISCWGAGWNKFSSQLGPATAKSVITDLSLWVQTVKSYAKRQIDCAPIDCKAFCQDECVAISLIAASQHKACPALQACAFALIGTDEVQEVVDTSDSFAHTLKQADIMLERTVVIN